MELLGMPHMSDTLWMFTRGAAIFILIVGIAIPVFGTIVLLRKEPSKTTVALVLANFATVMMNIAYAFMLTSSSLPETQMAMKIEYIGNAIFVVAFINFLYRYLRVNYLKFMFPCWAIFEAWYLIVALCNDPRGMILKNPDFEYVDEVEMHFINAELGPVQVIRYCALAMIFIVLIVTTIYRKCKSPIKKERLAISRVQCAEIIMFLGFSTSSLFRFKFDITPGIMAISIFIIDLGIFRGELIRVTDMGREWIYDNISTGYIMLDAGYRFLECNNGAVDIFPELKYYPAERRLPQFLFDTIVSNESVVEHNDRKYNMEILNMMQDDDVMGLLVSFEDVTERYELMEQLKEETVKANEANEAKSKFVSTISHEIRTPMNAIIGITDILLRKKRDKEDTDYLMNIKRSGDALLLIINDILDFSKIEAGQMKVVADEYVPAVMLNDMHMIFVTRIGSKPIELRYEIMEDLPGKLWSDALRIRQIIINFMNNAIKFTDSGSVTLRIQALEETEDNITLEYSVIDTGLGIKEEDLGKLFNSFCQVDEKKNHSKEGTGLGLAICKQLAELMGGYVGVESTYGIGSRFYAVIPQKIIDRNPVEEIESVVNEEFLFHCPNTRLLLVDDNEMNLKVAKGLLEPLNMSIDTVVNGKKAIEAVETKAYDIVFMDHMMPVMDGVEATRIIRAKEDSYFKDIPILALSANVTQEAREEFEACGMNAFLAKPIKMNDVCAALKKYLPAEQIIELADDSIQKMSQTPGNEEEEVCELKIDGLDVQAGIEACGTKKLYIELLSDFYKYIDSKANKIEKCINDHMLRDYTIEVHALKNTSRMIGALELSEEFKHLEELGNKEDEVSIIELTPISLNKLRTLKSVLEPFSLATNDEKKDVSVNEIKEVLQSIREAMDTFDLDGADDELKKLLGYKVPDKIATMVNELDALVADVAIEDTMSLCDNIIKVLDELE